MPKHAPSPSHGSHGSSDRSAGSASVKFKGAKQRMPPKRTRSAEIGKGFPARKRSAAVNKVT